MLVQAAYKLNLDLSGSFLVGDVLAARVAGVRPMLVMTGRGSDEVDRMLEVKRASVSVVKDLAEAVDHILATTGVRA
jgi:histidinol phosphatase-like enzyme